MRTGTIWMSRARRWLEQRSLLVLLLAFLLLVLPQNHPPPGAMPTRVDQVVSEVSFDIWGWEAEALWGKFTHWLLQPQRYMEEADRCALVRGYVAQLSQIRSLEGESARIYADPTIDDPEAVTADLRREWTLERQRAATRQPIAEAILEEQVSDVLSGEGLGFLGQPFPPVGAHFTPLPYMLIVSPRERIETIHQRELVPGLELLRQQAIEEQIDTDLGVSSLVTAIGGMSAWPAMLLEHPSLPWIAEVTAHEWTHHRLGFHPLGWAYERSQEARTINETTASIVGEEVGRIVLARYYPDLLPPEAEAPPEQEDGEAPEPPIFDFRLEMRKTRIAADELLAEGRVEEAEQYMEERRQFFWENGYRIRKLNQAYFAFHGSYAAAPGAAGEDPIGPAVVRLRSESASLRAFLNRIDSITTLAELETALARTTTREN